MLKWPERAKPAVQRLFSELQDIDVYVEDTNDEPFYRSLIKFATNGELTVARVFALGGRRSVIETAKIHDYKKRRALFIIDGDLYWVKGEPTPNVAGLHCHDAYCVENLLLCEQALSLVLSEELPATEADAQLQLAFSAWISGVQESLLELFAAFATVHTFDPTVPTVSNKVAMLCSKAKRGKYPRLDPTKVEKLKSECLAAAEKVADPTDVLKTYKQLLTRIKALPSPIHAISGKDFLLPLIDFRLQEFGCRIKRATLRVRLAKCGDKSRLNALATALRRAATS
ncbi:DUF4435 domain-containing protein [Silvimonas sp.]|uniref:DUF4435 domain-containing protein n=1 Tax=Silvimonas sp. TaxID=2650811 RepID=UPI00283E589C|nr:DUF4435 domain-containing protein [Silvimonas sp.]MDR3429002.1 DUF4435 domain-containing protein [Silvimonas sp.]